MSSPAATHAGSAPEGRPLAVHVGARQTHKGGERDRDCQDAWWAGAHPPRVAVADGATRAFFAREWAWLVTEHFCVEGSALAPALLRRPKSGDWRNALAPAREAWRETVWKAIQVSRARGLLENRFRRKDPAVATLVGLELDAEQGAWRAVLIGDSCLLRFDRSGAFRGSIPAEHPEQFGNHPEALISVPGSPRETPPHAGASFGVDEVLVLATDALSKWLLGLPPDRRFPAVLALLEADDATFHERVSAARCGAVVDAPAMDDDDVTLLVVAVGEPLPGTRPLRQVVEELPPPLSPWALGPDTEEAAGRANEVRAGDTAARVASRLPQHQSFAPAPRTAPAMRTHDPGGTGFFSPVANPAPALTTGRTEPVPETAGDVGDVGDVGDAQVHVTLPPPPGTPLPEDEGERSVDSPSDGGQTLVQGMQPKTGGDAHGGGTPVPPDQDRPSPPAGEDDPKLVHGRGEQSIFDRAEHAQEGRGNAGPRGARWTGSGAWQEKGFGHTARVAAGPLLTGLFIRPLAGLVACLARLGERRLAILLLGSWALLLVVVSVAAVWPRESVEEAAAGPAANDVVRNRTRTTGSPPPAAPAAHRVDTLGAETRIYPAPRADTLPHFVLRQPLAATVRPTSIPGWREAEFEAWVARTDGGRVLAEQNGNLVRVLGAMNARLGPSVDSAILGRVQREDSFPLGSADRDGVPPRWFRIRVSGFVQVSH